MLLGFAPLIPLRKTSTSLRSAQDDRLSVWAVLSLTYTATCHPEPKTFMGDMHKNPKDLRRSRFTVSLVGIPLVFSKVNFASQKRSFTCLALLDVQDDKSVCAVG